MRLNNKVAIITGGGSGIGQNAAERFAAEGANVIVADRNEAGIAATLDRIKSAGGKASGHVLDVSDRDQCHDVMRRVTESEGQIDILINNAGISGYRPFADMTGADWDRVLDVDLKGVFFCAQAVAPFMVERNYGRIVNISSALGTGAAPHNTAGSPGGSAAYASAKAAVILLTKTLARELGPNDITVNAIAPGTFLTAISSSTRTPDQVQEHLEYRKKTVVMNRIGTLEELSGAMLFFASDDSSYVTGQCLSVDGGRSDRM
ncbi:3-oxoacyl-ACP reductase [Sulfitobacter sp. EhC04]|uniref:SDR family NAD(P)-dependent oxidoreductase n=1 Tax=Sulfitobacter sp. EhC04 TaxID=1849168 RepID=UPI0007F3EBBB|nr:SDR family NAD(P)-dependent oxidoreductase [Sulfitobacter sp. EhC04]OAN75948.1 3-oxoacyl-ACP reductase [Sulfitobacter sp. EhC04]